MARLFGFVLGALLVIGVLAQLGSTEPVDLPEADAPRADAALPMAATTPAPVDPPVEVPAEVPAKVIVESPVDDTGDLPAASNVADAASVPEPAASPDAGVSGFFEEDVPATLRAADAVPAPETLPRQEAAVGQQWQPVWQAFAARRSAEGFAQRLASLTGLQYRVEKTGLGRYQAEVEYADEADRVRALSRIEQATGLVLARSNDDLP